MRCCLDIRCPQPSKRVRESAGAHCTVQAAGLVEMSLPRLGVAAELHSRRIVESACRGRPRCGANRTEPFRSRSDTVEACDFAALVHRPDDGAKLLGSVPRDANDRVFPRESFEGERRTDATINGECGVEFLERRASITNGIQPMPLSTDTIFRSGNR